MLKDYDDLNRQIDNLYCRVEAMESRNVNETPNALPYVVDPVHAIGNEFLCGLCSINGHRTNDCPYIPAYRRAYLNVINGYNRPHNNSYANMYYSEGMDNSDYSWRNDAPQQFIPSQQSYISPFLEQNHPYNQYQPQYL